MNATKTEIDVSELSAEELRQLIADLKKAHRSKHKNIKTEVDGYVFDSELEANRYSELKLLYNAGEIFDLTLQPKFAVRINGRHICNYFADFQYENKDGDVVVEDAKGQRLPMYILKKKLVEACYGIEIVEIT